MIGLKRIFPECDADTLLVQLIHQRGLPVHCKGIHKVANSLERFTNNTQFVIGLIDNDKMKNQPTFIRKFKVLEENAEQQLTILHLPETEKYIARLNPAFEKLILSAAEVCNIQRAQYGFDSFEKFRNAAKDEGVYDNKNFKKFINAVIEANPPAIQTLRYWLNKANNEN